MYQESLLYQVVRAVAWFVWGVVGLALWVPFLLRTMVAFNGTMVYATMTRNRAQLFNARQNLEFARTFYVAGFRNIDDWTVGEPPEDAPRYTGDQSSFGRFVLDVAWAAAWWGVTLNSRAVFGALENYGSYFFGSIRVSQRFFADFY